MKKSILSVAVLATMISTTAYAAKAFDPSQKPKAQGQLGTVFVDAYGLAPQTAIIDLGGYKIEGAKVTVQGKGKDGIDITYNVEKDKILTHNGIPVFGLYADYNNTVTVSYVKEGKQITEDYKIYTAPRVSSTPKDGMKTNAPVIKPVKVDSKYKDRLYMVNHIFETPDDAALAWKGNMGSQNWSGKNNIFVTDTTGEVRWTLDTSHFEDYRDITKRGIMMGFHQLPNGDLLWGKGQQLFRMDMFGKMVWDWDLPRGYLDFSHDVMEMDNGHYLLRAAKADYLRADGKRVHTVRDHILEMDEDGKLVDVWDLNEILDNMRDDLLIALDAGAVCLNVDNEHTGETIEIESDAPFTDIPGVGAGRNWAHVNSVEHDNSDDSIILSLRHQGVVKIGRNKVVKWILSPSAGWKGDLASKVLTPVNSKGKEISCSEKGLCEGDFDFTYTQHTAWLTGKVYNGGETKGLTVFDNGDGRHYEQPAMPTMKYSRAVEYKVNEKDMTVEQVWEYGKDRGYDWYSAITSNVSYQQDTNSMFIYSANTYLQDRTQLTRGVINEVKYNSDEVGLELEVISPLPGNAPYRATIINPELL
ncbi:aryl-sulfate sulfotransferase [Ferrimonas lipolytica]|uniref:Aryl-sulfate sulfotransferase n=1 Tax=Ferrimonas lipolytica TaxID=2724191 RepID=A0A6H1UEF6_9GAMM|nr:aryl-sulfate sulfotransferase [Ferrimonas lipolytica]QIZ77475.1 aryl-sulfate sulfotransferase [Ferrimonas lipolytica]